MVKFGFPPAAEPPEPTLYTTFSHYNAIPPELGGTYGRSHNLGCGVITLGTVACGKSRWTAALQKAFNKKFLRVLYNFADTQTWSRPPGLALAVVRRGSSYYLQGAGFKKLLDFANPIHDEPPAALELWALDLNTPEIFKDMKTIWEWRVQQRQRKPLHGPCGPLHFTLPLPKAAQPFEIPF